MDSSSPNQNITLRAIVLDVRTGLAALTEAKEGQERTSIASLLRQQSVTLAEKAWDRHVWLQTSDDWLTAHKDELTPEDLKQREDAWILKLRQYQVAMQLLADVLTALNEQPAEQAAMPLGMTATTRQQPQWEA